MSRRNAGSVAGPARAAGGAAGYRGGRRIGCDRDRGSLRDVAEDRASAVRRLDDPPRPAVHRLHRTLVLIPSDE